MEVSAEVIIVIVVTFLAAYYIGWLARQWWETKKGMFIKTSKKLKKEKKK